MQLNVFPEGKLKDIIGPPSGNAVFQTIFDDSLSI